MIRIPIHLLPLVKPEERPTHTAEIGDTLYEIALKYKGHPGTAGGVE